MSAIVGSVDGPFAFHPVGGEAGERIKIPLSQKVVRGVEIHRRLRDVSFVPDRTRLVPRVNRHAKGTPDRRRRGTPLADMIGVC